MDSEMYFKLSHKIYFNVMKFGICLQIFQFIEYYRFSQISHGNASAWGEKKKQLHPLPLFSQEANVRYYALQKWKLVNLVILK